MQLLNKIILGISDTHDASAAIIQNGKILHAVAEERVQRVKSAGGFPKGAIKECLENTNLTLSDIDYVAVAGTRAVPVNMLGITSTLSLQDYLTVQEKIRKPKFYENKDVSFSSVFLFKSHLIPLLSHPLTLSPSLPSLSLSQPLSPSLSPISLSTCLPHRSKIQSQ